MTIGYPLIAFGLVLSAPTEMGMVISLIEI